MVVSDTTLQLIPEVFYGIQVRTAGRPVHSVDASLLHEVLDKQRSMRSGVVILVHSVRAHRLQLVWELAEDAESRLCNGLLSDCRVRGTGVFCGSN